MIIIIIWLPNKINHKREKKTETKYHFAQLDAKPVIYSVEPTTFARVCVCEREIAENAVMVATKYCRIISRKKLPNVRATLAYTHNDIGWGVAGVATEFI